MKQKTKRSSDNSREFKKFLSADDVIIAKQLYESNTLSLEQLADKFAVHPVTITNRIKDLNKSDANNDNPVRDKELTEIINLLIIIKKRLTTQLAQVNFDDITDFETITKYLKTLTSIFAPLHTAYRSETSKSAAVQVNLTQIVEKNWCSEEERKKKIIHALSKNQPIVSKTSKHTSNSQINVT